MSLTARQEAFARAYVANGYQAIPAAREAGYAKPDPQAFQVLGSRRVQARIAELAADAQALADQRRADAVMSAAETLERLTRLGRASLANLIHVTPDGDPFVDISKAGPNEREALAEATIEDFVAGRGEDAREVRRVRVKLHPKLSALEALAKHHGLLTERVELTADASTAALLERARLRAIAERRRQLAEHGPRQIIDTTAHLLPEDRDNGNDR